MTATAFRLDALDSVVGNTGPEYEESLELAKFLRPCVTLWQAGWFVRSDVKSFGLVVANPAYGGRYHEIWNDPQALVKGGMLVSWGADWRQYAANALRKMRATARTGFNTLELDESSVDLFRDRVPSFSVDPDNPYEWGDFPHGGAVLFGEGDRQLLVGVSGLTAREDDMVARLAANYLTLLRHGA